MTTQVGRSAGAGLPWRRCRARPRLRRCEHAAGPCSLIPFGHKKAEHLCIGRAAASAAVSLTRSCLLRSYRVETQSSEKQEEILPKQIVVRTSEKHKRVSLGVFLASMFSLFAATGHAAAIKVMCDSPVEPALTKVADLFRQETNNQVTLACNAGPAIKKRIEDGEVADVVVVEPDFVEGLPIRAKWTRKIAR